MKYLIKLILGIIGIPGTYLFLMGFAIVVFLKGILWDFKFYIVIDKNEEDIITLKEIVAQLFSLYASKTIYKWIILK